MKKDKKLTKFNYELLFVLNHIYSHQSYTKSCIVKNQLTGEIIDIDDNTNDILLKKIIDFIDNNDLEVGDEFNINSHHN